MKTTLQTALCSALFFLLAGTGCKKENLPDNLFTEATSSATSSFIQYTIPRGAHYAIGNDFKAVDAPAVTFTVRFDSSCIYQTVDAGNQWDINKLYGFSDNGALHHQFSARIGWRWSEGALRLFAYTYNNAVREAKELAVVPIGKEVRCTIKVDGGLYYFSVDEKTATMPRLSATPTARGYKLYPYFGGDEVAPHDVRIWIREEA